MNLTLVIVVAAMLIKPGVGVAINRFDLAHDQCVQQGKCVRSAYTWLDSNGFWTNKPPGQTTIQPFWSGGQLYFAAARPITRITFIYHAALPVKVLLNGVEIDLPPSRAARAYSADVNIPTGHWARLQFNAQASIGRIETGQGGHAE